MPNISKKQQQVFDQRTTPLILEGLLRRGWDKRKIAEWLGVNVRTLDYWIRTKPEIKEVFARSPRSMLFDVENSLAKRALGYDVEEITTEVIKDPQTNKVKSIKVKTVKKHIPADVMAIRMYLSAYDPEYWGVLREMQLTQVNTQVNVNNNEIPKIVLGAPPEKVRNKAKIDINGRAIPVAGTTDD